MAGQKLMTGCVYNAQVVAYTVDSEDDLAKLPTIDLVGASAWCRDDKPPMGSTALVVSTGKRYILGTNGWTEYTCEASEGDLQIKVKRKKESFTKLSQKKNRHDNKTVEAI